MLFLACFPAAAQPSIDAPALAARGPNSAGLITEQMGQPDRKLAVTIFYPARPGAAPAITYHTSLVGPDGRQAAFTLPGTAVANVAPSPGRFPLIILAHGFNNTPEVLAWLAENLATKGYLVAVPAFGDPPKFDAPSALFAVAHRAVDIAVIAAEAQRRAIANTGIFAHADASRTALIGYSMGGYGTVAAAGAPLAATLAKATPAPTANLKAIVAISPATHLGPLALFAPNAYAAIKIPTFLIAGSQDHVVGYDAVRTLFDSETNAPRYLLTFREAGHNIALTAAPPEMRTRLWDQDWFEDPVWSKPRLIGIEAHFITAFLDRYVKGDATRAAYLDGLTPNSNDGNWPNPPTLYGAYSPGPPTATLWTGFQPAHASGMTLEFKK